MGKPTSKVTDLMAALEQSVKDAKAARRRREMGESTLDEQIASAISNPGMTPETRRAIEALLRETYARLVEMEGATP